MESELPISNAMRVRLLAAERGDATAATFIGRDGAERSLTWSELDRRSSQVAAAFLERGTRTGDHIAIGLQNSPQFTIAVLAAWKVGATPIPVRWDLPSWELERVRSTIAPAVYLDDEALGWFDATADDSVPELPDAVAPHSHGICSSGSTGTPKIIKVAAPSLLLPNLSTPIFEMWQPVDRPQRVLTLGPMYHVNGFVSYYYLLATDAIFVLEKFDAALALDVIERHRVTTFTATPTMLQRIADVPGVDDRDLSSLVWILQGAAPMPPSLVKRWAGLIGAEKIAMAYGMTEGLGLTSLRADEYFGREGSVGRPIRETEIRVLDDDLVDVPTGQPGEVYLRSPMVDGYVYVGEAPRLKAADDGFETAGDIGYLDADGYLYLIDRRVDMIVTGGANVFPAEVEAGLIDHPKIADVVVIGLADEQWGRRVHALVEPTDPADPPAVADVIAYAKSRLAAYKVPKTVEFVDVMPRSAATKVSRSALIAERGG